MNRVWLWLTYHAMLAWFWLKRLGWSIRNFAPWKAILMAWLFQSMLLMALSILLALFGYRLPSGILGFVFEVFTFYLIYIKVYPWMYPDGWKRQ